MNATSSRNASAAGKRFPRTARLLQHGEFDRVYREGKRHFSSHMTVFYLLRSEGEGLRVGLTVSRALGGAVDRNRIRRRLREAIRLHRPEPGPCADLVINPKKSALTADFADLAREVERAFDIVASKLPNGGRQ